MRESNGRPMPAKEPGLTIFSDASLSGWGAVMNEVSSRGPWTLGDKNRHINELEFLAALNGLKCFTSQVSNLSVRLMLDIFTVVHYINKSGGTRSPALSAISADIVDWFENRKLSIEAIHLPGVLNVLADQQSRLRNESSDWRAMETPGIDVPADSGPLGARDRLICLDMESTIGPVCQLEASAGSNGSRRFFPELDQPEEIRISPV